MYHLNSKFNDVAENLKKSRRGSSCYSKAPRDDIAFDLNDDNERDYLFKPAHSTDPSRPKDYVPPSNQPIKDS